MRFFRVYGSHIITLLIGLLFGFFFWRYPYLMWESQINPMDFANLILTLILAWIIGFYIEPHNEERRVEKDLLIEQLKEVKIISKSIHDLLIENFHQNPLKESTKQKILNQLRNLSNQMQLFLDQSFHCQQNHIVNRKIEIQEMYYVFKRSITGGNFQASTFTFSAISVQRYELSFRKFEKEVNNLILDVNRT